MLNAVHGTAEHAPVVGAVVRSLPIVTTACALAAPMTAQPASAAVSATAATTIATDGLARLIEDMLAMFLSAG